MTFSIAILDNNSINQYHLVSWLRRRIGHSHTYPFCIVILYITIDSLSSECRYTHCAFLNYYFESQPR